MKNDEDILTKIMGFILIFVRTDLQIQSKFHMRCHHWTDFSLLGQGVSHGLHMTFPMTGPLRKHTDPILKDLQCP